VCHPVVRPGGQIQTLHLNKDAQAMKTCAPTAAGGLTLILALTLGAPGAGEGQSAAYLDYQSFTRELRAVVDGSRLATMESLGTTLGGRNVWMVRVGDPSGSPLDERPGVLVVGTLEGDHVVGSQLSLEAIRYLTTHAETEAVRSALAGSVFYFFPRLNPDGAEAMFDRVRWNRRTNGQPWDEDNDGRVDEDGPEDLNGDGYITVMRVPDPAGRFMIDTADARAMKRADPSQGETGAFTLYWEGRDNDGDGFINEDGPGGVDLNRNFQHAYPYWTGDAGPHMVSEVETRALMDFVLDHRNIAAILAFGESDNLVTPPDARGELAREKVPALPSFADASLADVLTKGIAPTGGGGGMRGGGRGGGAGFLRGAQVGRDNDPSSGTRPATTVAGPDQVYFKAVSDAYKRITGIETVPLHRAPEGAFFEYGYFQFGVPSFSALGWGFPRTEAQVQPQARASGAAGASGTAGNAVPRGDAALLAELDAAGIDAFAEWTPFLHPELGEVEIGGFLPYVTHNPPAEQLPALGAKHGEFLAELAGMLPRVRISRTEVEALGDGLFRIEVEAENIGFFPTSLRHGQTSRSVGPTFLQIQVENEDILSGAEKTASVGVLAGSGSREKVTWVIRGRPGEGVEIKLHSQKAGRDTVTLTLR
jgi:hypothetical protein